jgi:GTP cyclohydrolase-4
MDLLGSIGVENLALICFPDTQDNIPSIPVHLTRVGVTGVKKLLKIERERKRPIILIPTFDAFVDLPSTKRGIHMSRNPEAISEVLEEVVKNTNVEVESLCAEIVNTLLKKHKYAKRAEVSMKSDFMFMKKSPVTKHNTQEMTKIMADAIGYRDGDNVIIRKMIGAEVVGMTVCPCAQESVKESSKQDLLEFLDEETAQKVLDTVSFASHNQRGIGMIMIEVPQDHIIRGEDLIRIIEDSMSSSVCELLKRPDENAIVVQAHKNPMFVEDCVRNMVHKIVRNFSYLPDDTMVTVRQVNEESIHRHNAFAEKVATMGELKYEIEGMENK